jgi:hypothetical protein
MKRPKVGDVKVDSDQPADPKIPVLRLRRRGTVGQPIGVMETDKRNAQMGPEPVSALEYSRGPNVS